MEVTKWHAIIKVSGKQVGVLLPKVAMAVVVLLAFWLAGMVVKRLIMNLANHTKSRRYLLRLVGTTAKVTLVIIGVIAALGTMGINVTAMVASLGLAGFALGFALKDTLSNLLAGFMVLFYQPFKPGDHIEVTKIDGEVTDINLRYTVIQEETQITLVPNATVLNNPVTVKEK